MNENIVKLDKNLDLSNNNQLLIAIEEYFKNIIIDNNELNNINIILNKYNKLFYMLNTNILNQFYKKYFFFLKTNNLLPNIKSLDSIFYICDKYNIDFIEVSNIENLSYIKKILPYEFSYFLLISYDNKQFIILKRNKYSNNTENVYFLLNHCFKSLILNDNNILSSYTESKINPKYYTQYFHLVENSTLFVNVNSKSLLKNLDIAFQNSIRSISLFNKDFSKFISFKLKVKLNHSLFLNDVEVDAAASAHRYKNYITIHRNLYENQESYNLIIAHEIGHFYYWEYNKNKFNSNEFFKDFIENYEDIKKDYEHYCYYFQFNPNSKQKWNKTSEYFCEMFSLYVNGFLSEKYLKIFDKYFNYDIIL